jgi:hypothetical protein
MLFGLDAGVVGGFVSTPAFLKSIRFDGKFFLLTFIVVGILLRDVEDGTDILT